MKYLISDERGKEGISSAGRHSIMKSVREKPPVKKVLYDEERREVSGLRLIDVFMTCGMVK